MIKHLLPSIKVTLLLSIFLGIAFPVLITAISQFLFPRQANGSLIKAKDGSIIGSELIAQNFKSARYFHPRPSAVAYSGEASAGTNLGPCSAKLITGFADDPATSDRDESFSGVRQLLVDYRKENFMQAEEKVPVDAVTRSASGLDPQISRANAILQARRVSRERVLPVSKLIKLINKNSSERQLGFLGEPCVNVLKLNLDLDAINI
ncbi:MAG: potassium-transporting ATPase subunit KdpC [Candidatus Obscuribacterales bacterium]|nr:potassium-transporting ATPase subunit KdpC [Candidatus Obscuribacterales bacterium]